jgi:predicted amidohydrolase YtcJ
MGAGVRDPSARDVLDSLEVATDRTPPGTWIRAEMWISALNDGTLRRSALDRVAQYHPVMLFTPFGHGFILNTAAMRALDISDTQPDPLGGWYERDARGRLTGRLDEYAGWNASRAQRATEPESSQVANARRYGDMMLRLGVTSVQNMAGGMDPATTIRVLRAAQIPLRVRIFKFSAPAATSMNTAEWDSLRLEPSPQLVIGGRKWILDGTPLEGNAFTRKPYPGRPQYHGRLNFPVDSIRAMLAAALTTREQLALHVVGDSTAAIVLSLMEELAPDSVWRPHRVRIEHGGVPHDLWPRAASKGIVLVYNLQLMPPPPISRSIPVMRLDTILPTTIPIALGSDGSAGRSPYVGMYYALAMPFEPPISRELMVMAYTLGSAYAEHQELEKGTLTPGKLADLAVLSQDIFTVTAADLPKTESVLTIIGGRIVWDANVIAESRPVADSGR